MILLAVALAACDVPFSYALQREDESTSNPKSSDAQDLIFLGPLRPLLIRLHVTIYGKPFREVWQENATRVFAEGDRDGDGVVAVVSPSVPPVEVKIETQSAAPATTVEDDPKSAVPPAGEKSENPKPSSELDALAAAAATDLAQDVMRTRDALVQLANEHGGKLTCEVVTRYLERLSPPFAAIEVPGRAVAGQALFPLLDTDGDQQLTAEELAAAEVRLRRQDFDDDELITKRELAVAPYAAELSAANLPGALAGAGRIVLIAPDTDASIVRTLLLNRYDRDGDGTLLAVPTDPTTSGSPMEVALAADQLAALDADGDGRLDGAELAAFAQHAPAVELAVRLGEAPRRVSRRRDDDAAKSGPADAVVKVLPGEAYRVSLADADIELRRNNRNPAKSQQEQELQLSQFDADANGYLDANEAANVPNLAGAFAAVDRDGNGKIFGDEFNAYVERLAQAAACRLLLEVADDGQDLFRLLDTRLDNKLTARELRGAAAVLAAHDTNGDGRLNGREVPLRMELEVSRNTPARAQAAAARPVRSAGTANRGTATKRGPAWFQKLDRNDDGDVSRREFPGPADVFDRLDADHDGLIDADEAERAARK
jgi:Ca2+-binding EF-hand superfamily protein